MVRVPATKTNSLCDGVAMRYLSFLALPFLLVLVLVLVLAAPAAARDTVRLQLRWETQSQFMGYYIAQQHGLYEREGLQVIIVPGGPGIDNASAVRNGLADVIVEWLPTALEFRKQGLPLVNIAQIFQESSLGIVCHADSGIYHPSDLRQRTIGVWSGGTRVPFTLWINNFIDEEGDQSSMPMMVNQGLGIDLFNHYIADCISVTSYNEFWLLLNSGVSLSDITRFDFANNDFGFLEDGLYVHASRLEDAKFRDKIERFLRATIEGWQIAKDDPTAAATIIKQLRPDADLTHQTRMAHEVARLIGPRETIGLFNLDKSQQTLRIVRASEESQLYTPSIREAWASALLNKEEESADSPSLLTGSERFWTFDIYNQAIGANPGIFSVESKYILSGLLANRWFYLLDIIGTIGFGLSGLLRAQERRYDLWGALVLTSMPAVGGGTLRDVLISDNTPFIFSNPIYIQIVALIAVVGFLAAKYGRWPNFFRRNFERFHFVTDLIGMMAFTVIGAKVAILANLEWFWIPICSALTCAGGGVLLDVVTGREPRTFRGEIYEEIAILGGLLMALLLRFSDRVPLDYVNQWIAFSVIATMVFVAVVRIVVLKTGIKSPLIIVRHMLISEEEKKEREA